MTNEELEYEFLHLRDKIKKCASLLLAGEYIEVSFHLGCMHTICHENSIKVKFDDKD